MIEIVVAEFNDLCDSAVCARNNTIMREFVDEDGVTFAVHEPCDCRHIRKIAGNKRQGAFHADEFCNFIFKLLMRRSFAAYKA